MKDECVSFNTIESEFNKDVNKEFSESRSLISPNISTVLSKVRNSNPHNIIIGHLNVNSVKNKIFSIKTYFQNYLDLLVLAETKLDQIHPTAEIFIEGYRKPFRKDKSKHSGGLLLYVSEEIPSRELTRHTCPNDIQNIVIELNLRKQKWLVIAIYHPPSQGESYFLDCLSDIIDQYSSKYDRIVCIGDFNITPLSVNMTGFLSDHTLINLVKEPTCFKSVTNPSCIDLILTNQKHSFKHTQALETGISDFHKLIITIMKTCFKKSGPKQLIYRSYKKFDLNLFKSELSSKLTSNTELSYSHFNESLQTLLEKHAPLKSKFVRANEVPYMTKSWWKAIMTRSRLKNEYLKTPTPFNWMKYKRQRNLCVSLNRLSRREYFSKLDCKN